VHRGGTLVANFTLHTPILKIPWIPPNKSQRPSYKFFKNKPLRTPLIVAWPLPPVKPTRALSFFSLKG
jgi:hypothetical protein